MPLPGARGIWLELGSVFASLDRASGTGLEMSRRFALVGRAGAIWFNYPEWSIPIRGNRVASFDHLVCPGEQRPRTSRASGCAVLILHQLETSWLDRPADSAAPHH